MHAVYVCKVVAGTGMVCLDIECITWYDMCIPYPLHKEEHVQESAPMHLGSVYPVLFPAPTFQCINNVTCCYVASISVLHLLL